MTVTIGRRELLAALGGAAVAWPLAARAQQPQMPVVGFLNPTSLDANADRLRAFRQGLKETGYVEGENVRIEYRWAENQVDRLPMLAAELVRQRVNVIATTGGEEVALTAKAATMTIPIVFGVTEDPVPSGLVASHSRPGGNATGVNFLITELGSKQLGLLHELISRCCACWSTCQSEVSDHGTRDKGCDGGSVCHRASSRYRSGERQSRD
jgi:putative ABC transport system substrate-binding protein